MNCPKKPMATASMNIVCVGNAQLWLQRNIIPPPGIVDHQVVVRINEPVFAADLGDLGPGGHDVQHVVALAVQVVEPQHVHHVRKIGVGGVGDEHAVRLDRLHIGIQVADIPPQQFHAPHGGVVNPDQFLAVGAVGIQVLGIVLVDEAFECCLSGAAVDRRIFSFWGLTFNS